MQREGVTRCALLAVGGDDGDLTERFGGTHQAFEPVGEDAVVVRTQKTHHRGAPMPNRHSVLTIRAESRTARNWLGTAAEYVVGTGTNARRWPRNAATIRNSVSNS